MIKEIVTDAEALSAPAQPATIDDVSVAIDLLDTIQMIATIMNGMQEDFAYDR